MLLRPTAPALALGIVVATVAIALETLVVVLVRQQSPGETIEPIYLLGIIVISTMWGLGLAVATSLASTVLLTYVYHRPGEHFVPFDLQNGVIVVIFLVVALSTNIVAGSARAREIEAEGTAAKLKESSDRLRALAEQQAALRRVAMLVARGVPSSEVFSTVAQELARAVGAANAALWRYESDGTATLISAHDDPLQRTAMPVGSRWPLHGANIVAMIRADGRPARMDTHDNAPGWAAAHIRELGLCAGVGAPIAVEGSLWGAAVVASAQPRPLAPDTEARVTDFADLVATAIANAESRAELTASRARIVASADDARRRLERDLHDGAQQRLVTLGLELRSVQASVPSDLGELREQIDHIVTGLAAASESLQELSRGIHPAILSRGGLAPALRTLARRCPVPVNLRTAVEHRLPDSVEVAAYYAVAEALTNAAKYAHASEITVTAVTEGANFSLSVHDNGVGGADSRKGSGLIGLKDRVAALGGHMQIASPQGSGTSLHITIPVAR
ncbi:GAF domain-containing protein [Nocardia sp. NPDC049190]|uniref:GAF domain-containing protein n=1 Tax=Nocardia sp. NPDC049190 TaxID=3155650 RepID=UPI0033EE66F1